MREHEANKLDLAHLISKFYERFPLDSFNNDNERSFALGVFLSGAEIQRLGDYIAWDFDDEDEDEY